MMKRFQWKVVSLMMLVGVIPLLVSALVVQQLLEDTVALGLDERLGNNLTRSTEVYRNYITLRKEVIPLHARAMAYDPVLQNALHAGPTDLDALRDYLESSCKDFDGPDQAIVRLALVPGDVPWQGSVESSPPGAIVIDHSSRYWPESWRSKTQVMPLRAKGGAPWRLSITYAIPNALMSGYQDLGEVARTFDHIDNRKSALVEGYFKTFLATSVGLLALTFLLGMLLARATTFRLRLLADATERIARGDLGVQVPVRGQDEIAQLTESFNHMVIELGQTRQRLSYLERVSAWQEIARRLAHEIKNPLTPILLAVQQLDRKFDDLHTQPKRYRRLVSTAMEIVSEEVDALRRLVQEFSEFARLPRVQPAPTELGAYVEEIIRTNPQFEEALAPFDKPDEPLHVHLDPGLMRRVLINLIQNAREAVHATGADPTDSVCLKLARRNQEEVCLSVEDRGEGVPEANLARLFDPYFTTKEEGTGLGLAIVRKIVIDHGGDIQATSPLHEAGGARFTLTLPLRKVQEALTQDKAGG